MKTYLISKERAMRFLEKSKNSNHPGVHDWYVDVDGIFNLCFAINGVSYVYREYADTVDDVLQLMINPDNEVLGVYEPEEQQEAKWDYYVPDEIKGGDLSANRY